jgi:hypothetical protein
VDLINLCHVAGSYGPSHVVSNAIKCQKFIHQLSEQIASQKDFCTWHSHLLCKLHSAASNPKCRFPTKEGVEVRTWEEVAYFRTTHGHFLLLDIEQNHEHSQVVRSSNQNSIQTCTLRHTLLKHGARVLEVAVQLRWCGATKQIFDLQS